MLSSPLSSSALVQNRQSSLSHPLVRHPEREERVESALGIVRASQPRDGGGEDTFASSSTLRKEEDVDELKLERVREVCWFDAAG
jgi:hypothetical protein